jgi:hypothetical protein
MVHAGPQPDPVIRAEPEEQDDMPEDPFQSPQEMIFDANLEEFATKIGFICGLESNGKIKANEAYDRIKQLWKQLKRSKRNLLDSSDEKQAP